MMKINGNGTNEMIPSAYSHFLAKLQTSRIRNAETREAMAKEGAALQCLDDLDDVTRAIEKAITTLEATRDAKALSMKEEAEARAKSREAETATRKAEALARKAAKASQVPSQEEVPPQPSLEDGPVGP
jgi:hypothetical protein